MMWVCLRDSFLSIVKKDCKDDELLVRARRAGDIERVFGKRAKVTRSTDSDYLYRAVISKTLVLDALIAEIDGIDYENFKNEVLDHELHLAYIRVWNVMAMMQSPPPYSTAYVPKPEPLIAKSKKKAKR